MSERKIKVANSLGFCAGVFRAVDIVEKTLNKWGAPIYVRHDIVHNKHVVRSFKKRGVVFVEELRDVAPKRPVVFSAHGVSPEIEKQAIKLGLTHIDATCPIVKKIHEEAAKLERKGYFIVLIGHRKHPETIGTLGHLAGAAAVVENNSEAEAITIPGDHEKITYLTQTTLSPDDVESIVAILAKRFPKLKHPSKNCVCYATLDRQRAVRELAAKCDTILVIGSPESSNSNRLKEVAEKSGAQAYLIDSPQEIPNEILNSNAPIGVTAGASAPEVLVSEVITALSNHLPS
jgi:4-hydroxy-3-methylbut-2-enyl diphosphate reductase